MSQRKQITGLILLLTIIGLHARGLCAAESPSVSYAPGSQSAVSGNISDADLLVAQTAAVDSSSMATANREDWSVRIGAGPILSPAFTGSRDYQLLAVPVLKITYRNTFFASVEDGIGYAVINQNGWRVGPIAKVAFGRNEDGDNPFRVAGRKTSALRGLGTVSTTLEAGAFAEYRWDSMSAKIGLRSGLNGHEGLIGDLSVSYTCVSQLFSPMNDSPLSLSIGPRLKAVDTTYTKAFFGVDADQAAKSGLPRYSPGGGILSYGIGSVVIVPIRKELSAIFLAGYERLTGDAGSSPLVRERGSINQGLFGVLLSYRFGFNSY